MNQSNSKPDRFCVHVPPWPCCNVTGSQGGVLTVGTPTLQVDRPEEKTQTWIWRFWFYVHFVRWWSPPKLWGRFQNTWNPRFFPVTVLPSTVGQSRPQNFSLVEAQATSGAPNLIGEYGPRQVLGSCVTKSEFRPRRKTESLGGPISVLETVPWFSKKSEGQSQ